MILGTCWTTFVFMSRLKSECFWVKMSMFFLDTSSSIALSCEVANHRAGSQLKNYPRFGVWQPKTKKLSPQFFHVGQCPLWKNWGFLSITFLFFIFQSWNFAQLDLLCAYLKKWPQIWGMTTQNQKVIYLNSSTRPTPFK